MPPKKLSYNDLLNRQESQLESLERQLTAFQGLAQTQPSAAIIRNRVDALHNLWELCQSNHHTLVCSDDEDLLETDYFKDKKFGTYELRYLEATDVAAQLLSPAQPEGADQSSRAPIRNAPGFGSSRVDYLPKISLPTFDGKYTDWAKYSAYFESLIIRNDAIDSLQKLHYLLSSLTGEPNNLLKNTIFVPESFATAWQLLNSRYNNPRAIVLAQIDALLSLPSVRSNSVDSLRSLHNRVVELLAALEISKRFAYVLKPAEVDAPGIHGVSDIIVCLVTSKLDSATRQAWELLLGDSQECPHFSKLNKFLETRIRGLEAFSKSQLGVAHSLKRREHKGSPKLTPISSHALNLRNFKLTNTLVGIGNVLAGSTESGVHLCFGPKTSTGPTFMTKALVLRTLTSYAPRVPRRESLWPHIRSLTLADDHPMDDEPIQVIIGADLYGSLLLDGVIRGQPYEPIARNTVLGWVISGPTATQPSLGNEITMLHCIDDSTLNETLRKFWELENISSAQLLSPEESQCESHFQATHSRTESGRYVVRLPFKEPPPISIGYSRQNALRLMKNLSFRLCRNKDLKCQYSAFLSEYESLGHMKPIRAPGQENPHVVYLPHHPVLKLNSSTTKLRVVFNASALTSNFTSLNDHLLVGPKLQNDRFLILLQWRTFRFVYSADIAKMYRQILVHEEDHDFQRILWQSDPNSEIQEYQLTTLTYGTACAPYLALRVLKQLTKEVVDEGKEHPYVSQILQQFTYVDDCLFGANDISLLKQMRLDLIALLSKGHFAARKWSSNVKTLLAGIDPNDHGLAWVQGESDTSELKLLGLTWTPTSDCFTFDVKISPMSEITKRRVLSLIAKLYDPLGWIAPVVSRAKIFMQQLWRHKIQWDEPLPVDLANTWLQIHEDLPNLKKVCIPRWTQQGPDISAITLHGFADASTLEYAAAVYLRCEKLDGTITVSLLASKTKVAPLRTQSIPNLELCECYLLAQLVALIQDIPEYSTVACCCGSDSTIALSWIRGEPSRQKTFVANRVAKIHTLLPQASWHHVPTHDNPSDGASRGLSASELLRCQQWWHGPSWLSHTQACWPSASELNIDQECADEAIHLQRSDEAPPKDHSNQLFESLALRYSSWAKLVRITAYILRLAPSRQAISTKPHSRVIRASEFEAAENAWFKYIQQSCLSDVLVSLQKGQPVPVSHKVASLDPFIDKDGILRVAGRIWNSNLGYPAKHPALTIAHPAIQLFVTYSHEKCLHGGLQLTALTPGHFLVGGELTAIPEPTLLQVNPNHLSRWQLLQQLLEAFWKRWSSDYITSLQQRTKWRQRTEGVRIGQMVLIRENNLPPTKWKLERIVQCHPGADQLTHVVSVRTATTTLVRPLAKLALLPVLHEPN